jgi:hypothetical protein
MTNEYYERELWKDELEPIAMIKLRRMLCETSAVYVCNGSTRTYEGRDSAMADTPNPKCEVSPDTRHRAGL